MNAVRDVDEPAEMDQDIPPAAPLRRPRSPPRDAAKIDRDDSGSDRGSKKFVPPGHHSQKSAPVGQRNAYGGNSGRNFNRNENRDRPDNQDKPGRTDKSYRQGFDSGRPLPRRPQVAMDDGENRGLGYRGHQYQRSGHSNYDQRPPQGSASFSGPNDEEDWDDGIDVKVPPPQYRQYGVSSGLGFHEKRRLVNLKKEERFECDYEQAGKSKPSNEPQTTPVKLEAPEDSTTVPDPTPNIIPLKPVIQKSPTNQSSPANQQTPPANQQTPPAKQQEPPANKKVEQAPATSSKPPGSAADVTPTRKLVPKHSLVDLLEKGDSLLVSVENTEEECHSPGKGFVCLILNQKYGGDYTRLCEHYGVVCEADKTPFTPSPGDTFSVFNPHDESWYRARCLSATDCALLDSGKVLRMTGARCVRLPEAYESAPEFSAVLQADVELAATLKCTLNEKTANGWTVELFTTKDVKMGSGEISRWLPIVQYPPASAAIPEVPRPPVYNSSTVFIVHVTDCSNVFVRPSDAASQRAFDAVLHDAALAGLNAKPLTTPPTMGSYVIGKYTDGLHYRALVKRTNVKQNKYLLEYVEFGNCHVNQLENLSACPDSLQPRAARAMTSRVALRVTSQHPLTPPAEKYLDTLKDDSVELVLTIPDASNTAPSGSEVILTVASNKENVNKKVEEMCTPEWLQLQNRGGDVLETETIMYNELQFLDLQEGPGDVIVLDHSALAGGTLSCCRKDRPLMFKELDALTERMGKYCESELGREPYLPKVEELCIAQMPPYPQWFRAVLAEQVSGPGGAEAEVCYIDYGNMERIPVSLLRKMLPEFARAMPAMANTVEIEDFPSAPTHDMLERAVAHLCVDDAGRGRVYADSCEKTGPGWYKVKAPQLIAAMTRK